MSPPKAVQPALQWLLSQPSSLNLLRASLRFDFCELSRVSDICKYVQARKYSTNSHNHLEGFEPDHSTTVPAAFPTKERLKFTSNEDFQAALQPAVRKRQEYPSDITRYEALERESDVTAAKDHVNLLVDSLEYRHNVELWLLLLQFRKRLDGHQGIATIWLGLRAREVDIPTKGSAADAFWKTFISLCPSHKWSTQAIVDYATTLLLRTGCYYDNLYEEITARWLAEDPKHAIKWHKFLYSRFPPPRNVLSRLCDIATTSKASLEAFRLIYASINERSIYDSLISKLCASGNYVTAQKWHDYLVRHGDIPSSDFQGHIYYYNLQQLLDRNSQGCPNFFAPSKRRFDLTSEKQVSEAEGQTYFTANNEQSESTSTALSRKLKSYGFGDYLSTRPGILDDKICARVISTRAFSLKLIIEFFSGLGLKEIGPVALRELAIRVISPVIIAREMENLNDAGIAVKDNVFSRAMRYFIEEGQSELLSSMLQSDLHPDAYGSVEVQQRLLIWYLKKKMWVEANRTLEIVTYEHPRARISAWNTLLRYYIRSSAKWRWVNYLNNMRICRIAVSSLSLKCLFNHRLASRQTSKRTSTHSDRIYDNISSYANICLENLDAGGKFSLHTFHEIMKRLGMAGRMDELAFLAIRLVTTFVTRYVYRNNGFLVTTKIMLAANNSKLSGTAKVGHSVEISKAFRDTFDESLVDAIISWGFINGYKNHEEEHDGILQQPLQSSPSAKHQVPSKLTANIDDRVSNRYSSEEIASNMPTWTKGIQLVSQLKNLGITINPNVIVKSIRHRLWTVYGPAISSRPRNRMLKRLHRLSLVETVMLVNQAWGSPLFQLEDIIRLEAENTPLSRGKSDAAHDINVIDSGIIGKNVEGTVPHDHVAKSTTCSQEHSVPAAVRREEFLVYIFGEKRYVSKSEKRAVGIREWAHVLEQSGDTVWIGL